MAECIIERFVVTDDFLPGEQSVAMRADIDHHFSNPREQGRAHQVWNYWHVPALYTYLRTTPEDVIAQPKVAGFIQRLRDWSSANLGLATVSWPFLSLYVPGCAQALHNDSTNGRFGYVYSLTRNERATTGGETLVMHDGDLFRANLDQPAFGTSLYDLVEPRFNRLTVFDDRIPHAVQRLEGPMDPLEGRFVLHGHISEGGVVANGALGAEALEGPVADAAMKLREGPGQGIHGPLVYRIEIGPDGSVGAIGRILDRLASGAGADLDALRRTSSSAIGALRFPAAPGRPAPISR